MVDKLRYKLDLQMFAFDPPYSGVAIIIRWSEHITGGTFATPGGTNFTFNGTNGQQTLIINENVLAYNVEVYCDSGYEVEAKLIGNSENSIVKTGEKTFTYNTPNGNFDSHETIEFTAVPLGSSGGGSKQATINLSFNSSTGDYTLSSTDTSIAQISADKKSYIVKGKTYTPVVSKTKNTLYRLNSWTMPNASTVGTGYRSGTASGSPNTTSDYTSSEVRYYDRSTSYDYETKSISLHSTMGTVSGDTSYCTYTTSRKEKYTYTFQTVTWKQRFNLPNGDEATLQSSSFGGAGSVSSSATYRVNHSGSFSTRTINISINKDTGVVSGTANYSYYCSYTKRTNSNGYIYSFSSVTWKTSYAGWYKNGSPSTSSTSSSCEYRYPNYTYTTRCYSKFTFDASTGNITWSHRNGSTSYYNKVEDNSTFDIDDVSTYTHNSTTWNYDGDIVSQTKTALTINVSIISWKFTDKNGTTSTGSTIKFINKDGVETTIGKLNFQ